jgi:hypothetical protein
MKFENSTDSDCDGIVNWIKPSQTTAGYYPNGFTLDINLLAAKYSVPSLAPCAATVVLGGANLAEPGIMDDLMISSKGRVTVTGPNNGSVTRALIAATGAFNGKFFPPGEHKATPFGGVIYEKPAAAGYGLFLGTDQCGTVEISQHAEPASASR